MDFLAAAIGSIGGDPDAEGCVDCGQPWRPDVSDARTAIAAAPVAYRKLLDEGDPYRVPDDLTWHGAAYTWHVADVCRAWAERVVGFLAEPDRQLAGFDQDELADARDYLGMAAAGAAWAFSSSVAQLLGVLDAERVDLRFDHPDWGSGTFGDALRWIAHEVVHHEGDVRRCVG